MITVNTYKIRVFVIYFLLYFGYYKVLFFKTTSFLVATQEVVLVIIGFVVLNSLIKNRVFRINNIFIFLNLFFVWIYVAAIGSPSQIYASSKIGNTIVNALYCMLIYYISFEIYIYDLLRIIFKINFFLIFLYVVTNLTSIAASIATSSRIGNVIGDNPIWIGRFCTDTLIAMLIYDMLTNKEIRTKRILQYGFLFAVIFLTGSKSVWIALIVSVVMTLHNLSQSAKMKKKIITITLFLGIVFLLICLLAGSYLMPYIQSRIVYTFAFTKGSRLHQYVYTFRKILENPMQGYGLGSWPLCYWGGDFSLYPHCILLEMWFELGVVGISLFIIYNFMILRGSKNGNIDYKVLLILYMSNLIYAMFSGSISEGNRGVYLWAAIFAANYRKSTKVIKKGNGEEDESESNLCL